LLVVKDSCIPFIPKLPRCEQGEGGKGFSVGS
jgi:hypothetical protein